MKQVPKRIAAAILNSLQGGVVPRIGTEYMTVGRKKEIESILWDLDLLMQGGSTCRFIVGRYGSGKSFLMQIIKNYALDQGFVVADADLSPERRLVGSRQEGLATYRELLKNLATKTRPEGNALTLILEKWLTSLQTEVLSDHRMDIQSPEFEHVLSQRVHAVMGELESMISGFDLAQVILLYYRAYRHADDALKSNVLRWFRGEYTSRLDARRELGVNYIITDENWYEVLKVLTVFLRKAGYHGLLIFIDELVNIYKLPNPITRQYNYEKILTIFNDTLQGKASHIGFYFGGTPQSVEDTRRGLFSYEALKSRLADSKFAHEQYVDAHAPLIRIEPLSHEEVAVLIETLAQIHAQYHGYTYQPRLEDDVAFLEIEYRRVGADQLITPREIIRDYVQLLNISHQNNGISILELLQSGGYQLQESELKEAVASEFATFEV